jgi:predicted small secreted protein
MNQKSGGRLCAWAACVTAIVLVLASTSCATGRGFGRDVQRAGQNIEEAARR